MTEQFANFAQSTLSASISAEQTVIPVVSSLTFPQLGTFRIVVQTFETTTYLPVSEPELMIVTSVATNALTVQRGAEGTQARAYASGSKVTHILTAAVMQSFSGGGGTYTPQGVTTATVGGIAAGTDLGVSPVSIQSILDAELYPYATPTFSTFLISGQATTIEVGTTLSGTKSFAFTFTNGGNVAPNTLDILDVTGSTTLATNVPITSPQSADIGTVQLTSIGTYSWRGRADSTLPATFQSNLFTVSWLFRVYAGTNTSATLTEAQIEALVVNVLSATPFAIYSLGTGGYKYFCWPDSYGSPTAATGFKDTATNLAVAMASSVDDPAYGNVQNGWSYNLASVTNANGITTNYRVYRSKFVLGGAINVQVS